jgi:hypothetical protein
MIDKISWTDRVRSGEVLHRVKEERNVRCTANRREADWIGHVLHRNCLLKHVLEENIEVMGRQGRKRKQLLDDLEKRIYWKLKDAVYCIVWSTRFERGYGHLLRRTT